MKNILGIIILMLFAGACFGQSQNVRVTEKITKVIRTTDSTGVDTVEVDPKRYETIWKLDLQDTVKLKIKDVNECKLNDRFIIMATNTADTGQVILFTTHFALPGADSIITIPPLKRFIAEYRFDGSKLVQLSKMVQ